jgi:hypothetical protein
MQKASVCAERKKRRKNNATFRPEAGGTKVTFEVEYTVPIPVLGKLAEAIIVKMNDREGELILANLKARMEV